MNRRGGKGLRSERAKEGEKGVKRKGEEQRGKV